MDINKLAISFENFKNKHRKHCEIQITDCDDIVIDGCVKVISYDENYIRLLLCSCGVDIFGMELKMKNFALDGVKISGKISSLTFLQKELLK